MARLFTQLDGLRKGTGRLCRGLLWALWPQTCVACESLPVAPRLGGPPLCRLCRAALWPNQGRRCGACDAPLPTAVPPRCSCLLAALAKRPAAGPGAPMAIWRGTRAVFRYAGPLLPLVAHGKFAGAPQIFDFLGRALAQGRMAQALAGWAQAFVPVPLHAARLRARGFNQANLLLVAYRAQLRRAGTAPTAPVLDCLLRQDRHAPQSLGPAQGAAPGTARRLRLARPPRFAVQEGLPAPLPARILLVDDLVTTGSTLVQAAHALWRAGAQELAALVVARRA